MKNKTILYEITFSALAFFAVSVSLLDLYGIIRIKPYNVWYFVDTSIVLVFFFDYAIRLYVSRDKKRFFLNNIPDLIAILPFNSFLKFFRIAKLLRFTKLFKFFRLAGISGKFYKNMYRFLRTNGLIYALFFTTAIIFIGAVGVSLFEKISFSDALWWSFVTTTTVGYGDISPTTSNGRIIAAILMIIGIGTIGMITGTIATFFLEKKDVLTDDNPISDLILSASDLYDNEKMEVIHYINFLKSKRKN